MNVFGVHTTGSPALFDLAGRRIGVQLAPPTSHFSDINVLGSDFFLLSGAEVTVNYVTRKCTLTLSKSLLHCNFIGKTDDIFFL